MAAHRRLILADLLIDIGLKQINGLRRSLTLFGYLVTIRSAISEPVLVFFCLDILFTLRQTTLGSARTLLVQFARPESSGYRLSSDRSSASSPRGLLGPQYLVSQDLLTLIHKALSRYSGSSADESGRRPCNSR